MKTEKEIKARIEFLKMAFDRCSNINDRMRISTAINILEWVLWGK